MNATKVFISSIGVIIILILGVNLYLWQTHRAVPNNEQPSVTPTTAVITALPSPTPAGLGTTYITPVDWPPKVQVLDKAFTCTPAGSPIGQGGQTMKTTINGHAYCLTEASEGAAGSIYTTYTYTFARGATTVSLSFTLRKVQCANYDEPQKSACQSEQASFDVGPLVDGIAQGLH